MRPLFGLLYTFLFFSYVVTAAFIVFHLLRYSLNRKAAIFYTLLFLSVFGVLIFTNAVLFFSLPLDSFLISGASSSPY